MADMKLRLRAQNRFYYPDILLTCNPDDQHEYYKEYPCLIVEVLSPSTGEQWQYITLGSSDALQLDCLELDMAMGDVYEDVFP